MISVCVDWGSSSFRAFRFDSHANVIDSLETASGIKTVKQGNFEQLLREQLGHWISPGEEVVLSGMITSRNGWIETDYIACPAYVDDILKYGKRLKLADIEIIFLPGVSQITPADVMRGEELQMLGAALRRGSQTFVMPGTHSKWALMHNRAIRKFRTIPTGELFDLIIRHSLMGALAVKEKPDDAVFVQGVEAGNNSPTIISDIFTTRSSVLMNKKTANQAYHWLSGLLIGNEVREAKSLISETSSSVTVIGSAPLCSMYLGAFKFLGINSQIARMIIFKCFIIEPAMTGSG